MLVANCPSTEGAVGLSPADWPTSPIATARGERRLLQLRVLGFGFAQDEPELLREPDAVNQVLEARVGSQVVIVGLSPRVLPPDIRLWGAPSGLKMPPALRFPFIHLLFT
jgi:hypothetical protein